MVRWPAVDRDLRRGLLAEVRRRHNVEASEASAAHRLARLDQLLALVRSVDRPGRRPTGADEPPDLWLRMKARFRQAGGRP